VRREPLHPGAQRSLFPSHEFRYWGFYTDTKGDPVSLDLTSILRGGDAKCRIGQDSRDWNIFGDILVDHLSDGRVESPTR
jgi:hypothetical protein